MTTPNTVHKTVLAYIVEKAMANAEGTMWRVTATIPEISTDYQTVLYKVPSPLATQLLPQRSYNLLLERQALKTVKKTDLPYDVGPDGSRGLPWMYFWGLMEVNPPSGGQTIAPTAAPAQSVSAPAQSVPAGNRPDHQDLIMIQHAFDKTVVAKQVWLGLPEKTRGTFRDFQIELAQDATWLLDNVYRSAGYTEEALEIEVEEEVLDQSPVDGGEDEPY